MLTDIKYNTNSDRKDNQPNKFFTPRLYKHNVPTT